MTAARCRKTRIYRTPLDARIALADCRRRGRDECRVEDRRCSVHRGWHLTSMPIVGRAAS